MLSDETATLKEVADALGRPEAWLRRNWQKLTRESDFPHRVPGTWVWPRRAVVTWLRNAGNVPAPAPQNDNLQDAADPVTAQRRALEQRYGVSE